MRRTMTETDAGWRRPRPRASTCARRRASLFTGLLTGQRGRRRGSQPDSSSRRRREVGHRGGGDVRGQRPHRSAARQPGRQRVQDRLAGRGQPGPQRAAEAAGALSQAQEEAQAGARQGLGDLGQSLVTRRSRARRPLGPDGAPAGDPGSRERRRGLAGAAVHQPVDRRIPGLHGLAAALQRLPLAHRLRRHQRPELRRAGTTTGELLERPEDRASRWEHALLHACMSVPAARPGLARPGAAAATGRAGGRVLPHRVLPAEDDPAGRRRGAAPAALQRPERALNELLGWFGITGRTGRPTRPGSSRASC